MADSDSERPDDGIADAVGFLASVDVVCDEHSSSKSRRQALVCLGEYLADLDSAHEARSELARRTREKSIIEHAVGLIASGSVDSLRTASEFLGDFIFCSEDAARELLTHFDRVVGRYACIFQQLDESRPALLETVHLCANLAAACPSVHPQLIPLIRPVCLQIISDPLTSPRLRECTILLLANLSLTSAPALREVGIGGALLEIVSASNTFNDEISVAESVIIYLHGDRQSREVDALLAMNVIAGYCVPLLERTLAGEEFRGMSPDLVYSARVFQVLATSREYAQALVADPAVVPLLMRATGVPRCLRVDSDTEGRRLALEALRSLRRFVLWPREFAQGDAAARQGDEEHTQEFLKRSLPALLDDDDAGIRSAAAGLWAQLNSDHVSLLLLLGSRMEARHALPLSLWKACVLGSVFPFFASA